MEKARDFGTADLRAIDPGKGVTLEIQHPGDIFTLRSKAYRWNAIEGVLINCKISVKNDKESGTCRVTKRIVKAKPWEKR